MSENEPKTERWAQITVTYRERRASLWLAVVTVLWLAGEVLFALGHVGPATYVVRALATAYTAGVAYLLLLPGRKAEDDES